METKQIELICNSLNPNGSHESKQLLLQEKELREKLKSRLYDKIGNKKYFVDETQDEIWIKIKEATKGICPDCCCYVGYKFITRDHIIPRIRGGSHDASNMIPLCISCNAKKGNKVVSESYVRRVFNNLIIIMNSNLKNGEK